MKSDSKLMFRIADLVLHSLNGTLDEQGLRYLEELLGNNPLAAEYYIEILWTHIGLNSMEGISSLQEAENGTFDQELWQALAEHERTAPETIIPKEEPPRELIQKVVYPKMPPRQVSKFSLYTLIISTAAMLLFVLWLQLVPVPSPSVIVATLTDSINAEWTDTGGAPVPVNGDLLRDGEFTLVKGFAEITFKEHAKIILEAPANIELDGTNGMTLYEGKLVAQVPPEAFGFTVDTPGASVKDIGTEFGVSVKKGNYSEVYVFKGEVVLFADQDDKDNESKKERAVLKTGQARHVKAHSGRIEKIAFKPDTFIRSKEDAIYSIRTTGDIQYLRSLPPSLQTDKYENDNYIRLFLERKRVTLKNSVIAGFVGPGELIVQTYSQGQDKIIPAGTKVDSYLLHYDRVGKGQMKARNGSVIFPRSIVGLLISYKQLEDTDSSLGAPGTSYKTAAFGTDRGITGEDIGSQFNDILIISEDRHTLNVRLQISNIDQIRVLIAAPREDNEV